ncbi:MAG TPA: hypothetical protein VHO67_01535 [Polyangia bacterium]|nr:hypothetical protein [Polyangia bacterium]
MSLEDEPLTELRRQLEATIEARRVGVLRISEVVARACARGTKPGDDPDIVEFRRRDLELQKLGDDITNVMLRRIGITSADLDRLSTEQLPPPEERFERRSLVGAPVTSMLEDYAAAAFERLASLADRTWLNEQRQRSFRLTEGDAAELRLIGGTRARSMPTPQRFAHMLLLLEDFLNGREDLDFFTASLLVPEAVMLGRQIEVVPELGQAAENKLRRLPQMTDDDVSSTVYELLVGAACARMGTKVEMLEPVSSQKTPDYRIHWNGPPAVIECKRKASLTKYASAEAAKIAGLYETLCEILDDTGAHVCVDLELATDICAADTSDFGSIIRTLLDDGGIGERTVAWATVRCTPLRYFDDVPATKLFSPALLENLFGWESDVPTWDGLFCGIDRPSSSTIRRYRNPRALKWRSHHPSASDKKARGINKLLSDAISQVPDGQMGVIYIAYLESNREELADARTKHIVGLKDTWYHRGGIAIPLLVVNRLYPRPLGQGQLDLIDSTLPFVSDDRTIQTMLPSCIFTQPPRPVGTMPRRRTQPRSTKA